MKQFNAMIGQDPRFEECEVYASIRTAYYISPTQADYSIKGISLSLSLSLEMQALCPISASNSTHLLSRKVNPRKGESSCAQPHEKSWRHFQRWASPVMAAILTLSSPSFITPPASLGQTIPKGVTLFRKACIGCHDMGGNILQPGATLFMNDLQRNGVATEDGIYNITYYGKGRMPGFGEKCTPRGQCTFAPRLQEDEIKMLAEFVKSQADRGWPNIEIYGD